MPADFDAGRVLYSCSESFFKPSANIIQLRLTERFLEREKLGRETETDEVKIALECHCSKPVAGGE